MAEPPAIVIYMVDPFSFGVDNPELLRLSSLALMRCFNNILQDTRLPGDTLRQSLYLQVTHRTVLYFCVLTGYLLTLFCGLSLFKTVLQTISLDCVYSVCGDARRGLHHPAPQSHRSTMSRSHHLLRSLCMSLYTQSQRPLNFNTSTKTLTGFGPASSAERYLKGLDNKVS